jgi:nicotinate phosphoribosyltransferase
MSNSMLATDGYKLSMAEAGWPLRRETFYYSHRKGGPQLLPFDAVSELKALLPTPKASDYAFLTANEYEMGAGFKAAITEHQALQVRALAKGSVFYDREPLFSVTGPSALVSWLEPLLLQWSFRIQVATLARFSPEALAGAVSVVTCEAQRDLVLQTLDAVGVKAPAITVDSEGYSRRVEARVKELVEIVGDPKRLFEVGLRSASCLEQHRLALQGCKAAGLSRTSSVLGAFELGLTPVGTMGHEHVQRYGSDDLAFRAMTERRPQRSSFLLDTFDTMASGIPTALALIAERKGTGDSIRYDSGDKEPQYRFACKRARALGVRPVHILEDSFDAAQTRRFEALRAEEEVAPAEQVYGYGGYLVAATSGSPLTRDRVSAVYKLSQTGERATMKFANEAGSGKQSVPGRPVLFRREQPGGTGPVGIVGQEGEQPPSGYFLLTGNAVAVPSSSAEAARASGLGFSKQTQALIDACQLAAFGRPKG